MKYWVICLLLCAVLASCHKKAAAVSDCDTVYDRSKVFMLQSYLGGNKYFLQYGTSQSINTYMSASAIQYYADTIVSESYTIYFTGCLNSYYGHPDTSGLYLYLPHPVDSVHLYLHYTTDPTCAHPVLGSDTLHFYF